MEIEIKFPVENPEELIKKLSEIAEFLGENYQKDLYYTPSHNNFIEKIPVSEWLRIRETKNKFSIK
jgi:adenylate cyclase class IV